MFEVLERRTFTTAMRKVSMEGLGTLCLALGTLYLELCTLFVLGSLDAIALLAKENKAQSTKRKVQRLEELFDFQA